MILKKFILGFAVKSIASFDDSLTGLPFVVAVTRTRQGKLAFALGSLLAVVAVIAVVWPLSPVIGHIPHYRWFVAAFILLLAYGVWSARLSKMFSRPKDRLLTRYSKISPERFRQMTAAGFLLSIVTLVDDSVAFLPLFVSDGWWAAAGIMTATALQTALVIYLAERLERFRYRRQVTTAGLLVYAILLATGVV